MSRPTLTTARAGARTGLYAALDLGTNNCRLLVAQPSGDGFRVVESFSRIVRLGEGVAATGALQPAAMERTLEALAICADKVRRRKAGRLRAVATQACRSAVNGAEFLDRVQRETGLRLEVISPEEEARLSVSGCLNLIDHALDAALVLDVGGGSTELSWLDLRCSGPDGRPKLRAWCSLPLGVVTLAERFPEPTAGSDAWWRSMVEAVKSELAGFGEATGLRRAFEAGRGHVIGTSGAVTSLAGIHLRLPRYRREYVDGLWMTTAECDAVTRRLLEKDLAERSLEPCVGPGRADLVLSGAAILQGVLELWPSPRIRVADRGLREGLLLSLMEQDRAERTLPAAVRA